jgi:hypothetical protein
MQQYPWSDSPIISEARAAVDAARKVLLDMAPSVREAEATLQRHRDAQQALYKAEHAASDAHWRAGVAWVESLPTLTIRVIPPYCRKPVEKVVRVAPDGSWWEVVDTRHFVTGAKDAQEIRVRCGRLGGVSLYGCRLAQGQEGPRWNPRST